MFTKILLAVEGPHGSHGSSQLGAELHRSLGGDIEVFHLSHPTGLGHRAWDHQLSASVADEARAIGADLIVLQLDPTTRHHRRRIVRALCGRGTPVMALPGEAIARHSKRTPRLAHRRVSELLHV